MSVYTVAFVCTGNTCRSPMVESLAKGRATPASLEFVSAGVAAHPGQVASTNARAAIASRGGDLEPHRSRPLDVRLAQRADLILTMTQRHREGLLTRFPLLAGKVEVLGDFAGTGEEVLDPFGGGADDYERSCQQLERLISLALPRITTLAAKAERA